MPLDGVPFIPNLVKDIIDLLNSLVWSPALIFLCLATGIYFTFATRFLQVRHLKLMVRLLFSGTSSARGVSSFQAFALAVSGRVGTGNIAGVATAIALGGPGAIFWMWVIAFVGAGSAFVEATLAQIYKEEIDEQYRGGPTYYITKGLGIRWYGILFGVSMIVATGLLLPGIQSNSIAVAVSNASGIDPLITGIVVAALLGLVIFGGVKRISRTAEFIVPFMSVGYILVAIVVVFVNFDHLPEVIGLIVRSAFGTDAAFGGILGMAIAWGIKRGIYSNEAGQGTAPMAAAAAEVSHPAKQGLVQAFSVYFDTWFVCSATAFMILLTGAYNVEGSDGQIVTNLPGVEYGPGYTQEAINSVFPGFGSIFVAVTLFFFAFTTLMAYYYYAETNIAYLFKHSRKHTMIFNAIRVAFLGVILFGSIRGAELAWALGDLGVGITAWLNIVAIILLRKPALACLKDFEIQLKKGKDPQFNPADIGLENIDCWKSDKR